MIKKIFVFTILFLDVFIQTRKQKETEFLFWVENFWGGIEIFKMYNEQKVFEIYSYYHKHPNIHNDHNFSAKLLWTGCWRRV